MLRMGLGAAVQLAGLARFPRIHLDMLFIGIVGWWFYWRRRFDRHFGCDGASRHYILEGGAAALAMGR